MTADSARPLFAQEKVADDLRFSWIRRLNRMVNETAPQSL
jgi:hypothetical protein